MDVDENISFKTPVKKYSEEILNKCRVKRAEIVAEEIFDEMRSAFTNKVITSKVFIKY